MLVWYDGRWPGILCPNRLGSSRRLSMNRRTLWALGLAVPAALAAALALKPSSTDAPPAPTGAPSPDSARLPVSRVVLFSAGVGHFLREGEVDNDARVDLSFPA